MSDTNDNTAAAVAEDDLLDNEENEEHEEAVESTRPVKITYTPLDEGDPSITLCHGVRFKANLPVLVSPETHGTLIELAKKNPWYEVEGHPKAQRGTGKRVPKTSEEYRFYATQWFRQARSPAEFVARWKAEQGLRDSVGFGEDDQVWLDSIADPILHELEKASKED